MPLPKALRLLAPDRLRHDVRLRALGLGAGLIPPRTMHTARESELLAGLAAGRRTVVEIGVYEGSSAVGIARALPPGATLHLIDPFADDRGLAAGWRGTAWATRRVVARAGGDLVLRWHEAPSQAVGRDWAQPVDLVFVDGDHSAEACRADWELFSPWVVPGGVVAFHDARQAKPGGEGLPGEGGVPGPTALVDELFRGPGAVDGWRVVVDEQALVAVERSAA